MPFPFVAIAVSLAVSAATSAAAAALTPSQKIDKGGLNDLSVPKSSYGETIPQCWGQLEMAGNLIWATALKEVAETEQQGGSGGGATVTERSYFANFAVMFAYCPNRSVQEYLKIKLNGKTVYDPNNSDSEAQTASAEFASKYLRFYYGTESQTPDPLIQSTTPVQSYDYGLPHDPEERETALIELGLDPDLNHIPAYRYKAYVVFENLPLADYNNAIPSVKAEILFNENNTAATIVNDLCSQVSVTDINTTDLESIEVPGFYLDRQVPAYEGIKFLAIAYFFDIIKSGKTLNFLSQLSARPTIAIPVSDLAAHEDNGNRGDTFSFSRPDPQDLPESVEINFLDQENSYENGNVIARSQVAGSKKKESFTFPIVMTSAQATAIADTLLHKFYLESITPELSLPPSYAYLDVGDWLSVELNGELLTLQITKIWLGANRLLKVNTKLVDAENSFSISPVTIPSGGYNPPVVDKPKGIANTTLELLDIHLIKNDDVDNGIYATAYGSSKSWKGCSIYASADGDSYYFTKKTLDAPGTVGQLTSNFNSSSTSLIVSLLSGSFESVTTASLDSGVNKLLVGNEIIQFQTVVLNGLPSASGGNNYELSGLRRGLRGTESYKDAHSIGERVVLLTGKGSSIVRLPGVTNDLNQLRYFKAPSNGQGLNAAVAVPITIQGLSLKPYSPIDLVATKDNVGNISLSWTRRDRKAGDPPFIENSPLSEAEEKWEIEILTTNNTPIRLLESDKPPLVYTAQNQITDFSLIQSSLSVAIYQISAVLGRGYPLATTITPTVLQPPPAITDVVPSTVNLPATIDIYGTGLNQVTAIGLQNIVATNFIYHDDTHITCTFADPATVSGYIGLYTVDPQTVNNVPDVPTTAYLNILPTVDLSDYVTQTQLTTALSNYVTNASLANTLLSYATLAVLDNYMLKANYTHASNLLINQAKISYPVSSAKTLPYTLAAADLGLELAFDNATGILTIPSSATGFVTGWGCVVSLTGTGSITIQRPGGTNTGLVFGGGSTNNKLKTQGAVAITHKGSNIWLIVGRLEA